MFLPEYTISLKILKNISNIEYSKAIIESNTLLPSFQNQLQKEAKVKKLHGILNLYGLNIVEEAIKKHVNGYNKSNIQELLNLENCLGLVEEISRNKDFEEEDLRTIHKIYTYNLMSTKAQGSYRTVNIPPTTHYEEIIAEIVELFDWYHSLDAKETHPILAAGILKAKLETIHPFEEGNTIITNLASQVCLRTRNYGFNDYISIESHYNEGRSEYAQMIYSIYKNQWDYTQWLEYFTEVLAREVTNIKESVLLLAKDTKMAKVSGRTKLSERQEKIIEHLQDYSALRNKDFPVLFPHVSEDSVLRDLKKLIELGLIYKSGSTKSSVYELK